MFKKSILVAFMATLSLFACTEVEEVVPSASTLPQEENISTMTYTTAAAKLNSKWQDRLCPGGTITRSDVTFGATGYLYQSNYESSYFNLDAMESQALSIAQSYANSGPGWTEEVRSIEYLTAKACGRGVPNIYYIYISVTYQTCSMPCLDCGPEDPISPAQQF